MFFRIALFYAFIVTFFVIELLKVRAIKKNIWGYALVIVVILLLNMTAIISNMADQRGYEYENITLNQVENAGSMIGQITNVVAAFIGPFANFVSDEFKRNYITLYSFTPFCKMLISLFFLYGMYYALKHKLTQFFPLILFWLMNTFMIVFTFYALHDRFQWPHIPMVLVLSALGYSKINHSKHLRLERLYVILVALIIIIFNSRV